MVGGNQEQEGLGLEYLDKLTFFDEKFEYNGNLYNYQDIEHVEFTAVATKRSINFVPVGTSYDASLFLHFSSGLRLHIKQERVFLNRKQKERSEAVMRVAGIFMDITFNQRINAYERQMKEKGFVNWGDHQICRNGDLCRKNELRFNILQDDITSNLGPFQIEYRKNHTGFGDKLKELWFGSAEVIDISIDKDCFLYIMKNCLGLSWPNQSVPEKRRSGKEIFNEALLILGGGLCKADGRVSREEIFHFKQYFGIDDRTHPGASKIFMDAIHNSGDIKETANRIFELFEGKKEPLEYILLGLMQIAAADGYFDETEREFIRNVGEAFGFPVTELERLFLIFGHTQDRTASDGQGAATKTHTSSLRVQYLRILGLDESATIADAKKAYRDLAKKHHPDLLRAQGIPIDDIKNAEEIMKLINSAYEWLTHHQNNAEKTT